MKMNVSVELEGATETSGKLVELKKQIDVVNAELAKLRNICIVPSRSCKGKNKHVGFRRRW